MMWSKVGDLTLVFSLMSNGSKDDLSLNIQISTILTNPTNSTNFGTQAVGLTIV